MPVVPPRYRYRARVRVTEPGCKAFFGNVYYWDPNERRVYVQRSSGVGNQYPAEYVRLARVQGEQRELERAAKRRCKVGCGPS